MDSLSFNNDGTIRKVIPTLRGVGLTPASGKIQIDRYSGISNSGVSISFVDTADRFKGWKAKFSSPAAWLQYNSVDFGSKKPQSVELMVVSNTGGVLQIRSSSPSGPILSELNIPVSKTWKSITAKLSGATRGIQHLFITQKGAGEAEVDWMRFK